MTVNLTAKQLITFSRGAPSVDIIDVEGLTAAAVRAFRADPAGVTAYGTSRGYPPLRSWIARKHGVEVSQVLITNGSLQADAFLFDQVVRPGDDVVVERPTYDRTLLNLRAAGANLYQVGLDEQGLDVDQLRALLASGVRPTLVHVIPNFQNPAGVTMSAPRRAALLELAAEHHFTIFEDDPYADVRFRGQPVPSLLSMDAADRVVYASSFTKTVCPGVRVGYLLGPKAVIGDIARKAASLYISPSMVSEAIVHQFCAVGDIDRSIATICRALAERAALLTAALRTYLPEARFTEPDGGYFLWVELPEHLDAAAVVAAAAERGLAVVRGSDFLLEGGHNALRLSFSSVPADQVEEGVRRLAAAVDDTRR
jgi:DNA-binding transcriptional MocR family regulator